MDGSMINTASGVGLAVGLYGIARFVRWLGRPHPTLPPIDWPRGGDYHIDPTYGSTERWAHLAGVTSRLGTVEFTDYYLRRMGLGPVLDAELRAAARRTEAGPVVERPEPTVLHFDAGEPTCFAEYAGQTHFMDEIKEIVTLAPADMVAPLRPQMFIGRPGLGKTAIVKVIVAELKARAARLGLEEPNFYQLVGSDIDSVEALDAYVEAVAQVPGSVIFLDEIHYLPYEGRGGFGDKLLPLLSNNQYLFKGKGLAKLPPLTILAATTDYGLLHPALKRRFQMRHIQPMSREELRNVLKAQPMPITNEAADLIVHYTHHDGAPWEALQVYNRAMDRARVRGYECIDTSLVEVIVAADGLDDLGLKPMETQIIKALLKCPKPRKDGTVLYQASVPNVTGMCNIHKADYEETVRPKLMARGLLLSMSTGQTLTDYAVEVYG